MSELGKLLFSLKLSIVNCQLPFLIPLMATQKKMIAITPAMNIQSAVLNAAMPASYPSSFSRAHCASA